MVTKWSAVVMALVLLGCSDTDELKKDGQVSYLGVDRGAPDQKRPDLPPPDLPLPDLGPPDLPTPEVGPDFFSSGDLGPFSCSKDCYDYVIDRVTLPTTSAESSKFALVHKGAKFNALGNILALLVTSAPSMDVQAAVQNDICRGKTVDLLRVKAKSLSSTPAILAHSWVGADAKCCTSSNCLDSFNQTKCNSSAITKCFSGSGSFTADPKYPKAMILGGSISGGQLKLGPGKLIIRIALSTYGSMDLAMMGATMQGNITSTGITNGILSGGIPQSVINNSMVPNLTSMLDATYKNPSTDSSTKAMLGTLFDTNSDGTISTAEIKNNALIKTFLTGDVDVDGDGIKELSLGIGFNAVKASITP